ncbi:MAG: AI-2E family transporter [Halofilum sp. (in: g-proteobacteria)]
MTGETPRTPGFVAIGVASVMAAAALAALVLIPRLANVLLLLFAAVLFAILLDAPARLLRSRWRVPQPLGVSLVALALAIGIVVLGWLGEPHVAEQLGTLADRLPGALGTLREEVEQNPWGRALLQQAGWTRGLVGEPAAWFQRVTGIFSGTLGTLTNTALILVIGFYLAIRPSIYVTGAVRILPRRRRRRAREIVRALGHALRWWLLGRLISMAAVGVLTTLALWLIDMPLALGLGFIAGILSFVPFIGPILSAVPAILIALLHGPWQIVSVILVYALVQFIEGNIVTPLTQERVVALPPAVLLLSQVVMGSLSGITGLLLATPLAVVVIIIIQMVYIEDVLQEPVRVLGD